MLMIIIINSLPRKVWFKFSETMSARMSSLVSMAMIRLLLSVCSTSCLFAILDLTCRRAWHGTKARSLLTKKRIASLMRNSSIEMREKFVLSPRLLESRRMIDTVGLRLPIWPRSLRAGRRRSSELRSGQPEQMEVNLMRFHTILASFRVEANIGLSMGRILMILLLTTIGSLMFSRMFITVTAPGSCNVRRSSKRLTTNDTCVVGLVIILIVWRRRRHALSLLQWFRVLRLCRLK
mmetsp:Transcript_4914/g.12662  ORF Transcript_4914/g.12662 Transcript_4914/m.12662 type:complete len:236 (+) Transcript_4914:100-807(+)